MLAILTFELIAVKPSTLIANRNPFLSSGRSALLYLNCQIQGQFVVVQLTAPSKSGRLLGLYHQGEFSYPLCIFLSKVLHASQVLLTFDKLNQSDAPPIYRDFATLNLWLPCGRRTACVLGRYKTCPYIYQFSKIDCRGWVSQPVGRGNLAPR